VSVEPTRQVRHEQDFGPDSAYRLLTQANQLPTDNDLTDGWTLLIERFHEYPWPSELPAPGADSPWTAEDFAKIHLLLGDAAGNLKLARRAAAAPDPQVPTLEGLQAPIGYLAPSRETARLILVSAYVMAGEGRYNEAFDELFVGIRFGNILSRGGSLINHLVDMAISRMNTEAMWRIATRHDLPPEDMVRAARQLLELEAKAEPISEAMRCEAHAALSASLFELQASGTAGTGAATWLKATLLGLLCGSDSKAIRRDLVSTYQHAVVEVGKPCSAPLSPELQALTRRSRGLAPMLSYRDPIGHALASMLVPPVLGVRQSAAERSAVMRGTALFLAIRAYEVDHAAPPIELQDLVPKYLPSLPVDPFDGKPFRYVVGDVPEEWRPSEWGVYSIGRNGTDDGGLANRCVSTRYGKPLGGYSPDIVWLPFPFPRVKQAEEKREELFGN
jgi:hypothetical protein